MERVFKSLQSSDTSLNNRIEEFTRDNLDVAARSIYKAKIAMGMVRFGFKAKKPN